jgi:hypothetical protein
MLNYEVLFLLEGGFRRSRGFGKNVLGPRDLGCPFGATLALSFLLFQGSCMLLDFFVTFTVAEYPKPRVSNLSLTLCLHI